MPSRVSLGARSWFTGESAPSASPLAERGGRPRVREKPPQPSPTSPSTAALVRRGRDVRFASTDASAPPGSPQDEGGRCECVRGEESPSSPSLGSQSESSATAPDRIGRGDRITAAGVAGGCRGSASVWCGRVGNAGVVGPTGVGDEMGTRGGVVGKTWPSDAKEIDNWEGVRFFPRGRTSVIEYYRMLIRLNKGTPSPS
jgi:hypothetical protein